MHGQEIFQEFTDLNHSDLVCAQAIFGKDAGNSACVFRICCNLARILRIFQKNSKRGTIP